MKYKDVLEKLTNANEFENVMFIDGEWGIGKTHCVKEYLKDKESIYLTLFGINSMDELKYGIHYRLRKFSAKFKKAYKSIEGQSIGISALSLPIPAISFDIEKVIEKELKKRDLIIVIDDIERKEDGVNISELLGFVETLSQIPRTKIILIGNHQNFNERDLEEWNRFQEKVIKEKLVIDQNDEESIKNVIDYCKEQYQVEITDDVQSDEVIEFCISHRIRNLRTLQKGLIFYNEVYHRTNKYINKNDKRELIAICIAIVAEKNDELYLQKEKENKNDHHIFEVDYTKMENCILKNYFGESIFLGNKIELIKYLMDIYECINEKEAYKKIEDYFNEKHNQKEEGKDIFYYSLECIDKEIRRFVDEEILKKSDKNHLQWFKELCRLYTLSYRIHGSFNVGDDVIIDAMDYYIKKMGNEESLEYVIEDLILTKEKGIEAITIIDAYSAKVVEQFITIKIKEIEDKLSMNQTIQKDIEELFGLMNDNKLVSIDLKNKINNKLLNKQYFLANMNEEIKEDEWKYGFALNRIMNTEPQEEKRNYMQMLNTLKDKANDLGKYRYGILIDSFTNKH